MLNSRVVDCVVRKKEGADSVVYIKAMRYKVGREFERKQLLRTGTTEVETMSEKEDLKS